MISLVFEILALIIMALLLLAPSILALNVKLPPVTLKSQESRLSKKVGFSLTWNPIK